MRRRTLSLIVILAVAVLLRVILAHGGGQRYWPDEFRYDAAGTALHAIARGEWKVAGRALVGHADHPLFAWLSLPPALFESVAGPSPRIVGGYFSLFSVGVIALVAAIARRAGGSPEESLWAAFLASASATLFYYARHLLPYDSSLFFILLGTYFAVGPWTSRQSFWAGCCIGIGFLVYGGYWLVGGAVLIAHVLLAHEQRRTLVRGGWSAVGLFTPIAIFALLSALAGFSLPQMMREFSGTIVQGDFNGIAVIGGYLWSAEGLMVIVWAAASAFGLAKGAREPRVRFFGAVALIILGGLVGFSNVIPKFVVYGRLVRSVVPFLCLISAYGISRAMTALKHQARWLTALLTAMVSAIAAVNFAPPLRQWFPANFARAARARAAVLITTIPGNYRTENASFLFAPASAAGKFVPEEVVWSVPHPIQYRPFLYEGTGAADRRRFEEADDSMRLVRIGSSGNRGWLGGDAKLQRYSGYPGRVTLRLRFDVAAVGHSQPLVVTGESGKGDFVYVIFEDTARIKFGFDHWGVTGVVSKLIPVDYAAFHEVTIGMGSMYPASAPPELRSLLFVVLDGKVVFEQPQRFHPADPGSVMMGLNLIGGGSTESRFSGPIDRVDPASDQ